MNQEEQKKKVQKVIAKAWADEAFKQRLLSNPSEVLTAEGLEVPPDAEVIVHDAPNKVYYLLLPEAPKDVEVVRGDNHLCTQLPNSVLYIPKH
jgi:hypothetical protein